ncbi:hypothetical protein [Paraburkholderia sp. BL6665CI2N2]|uniref:hypothetical protein n=1 Tax=Paraburkholderia sp. BL6665CI2N2 TaxID=1938806 RepID=UPI001064A298|nr:hypothetical protein [Paraburkholderia sp. BL6665CI2N2]
MRTAYRFVVLTKAKNVAAAWVLAGFSIKLNPIAGPLRQRFTCDQGNVVATSNTPLRPTWHVYSCDSRRPWQYGARKHRRTAAPMPAQRDLSIYGQEDLDTIADNLSSLRCLPQQADLTVPNIKSATAPHL